MIAKIRVGNGISFKASKLDCVFCVFYVKDGVFIHVQYDICAQNVIKSYK